LFDALRRAAPRRAAPHRRYPSEICYFASINEQGRGVLTELKGSILLCDDTSASCDGSSLVITNPDRTWVLTADSSKAGAALDQAVAAAWADAINEAPWASAATNYTYDRRPTLQAQAAAERARQQSEDTDGFGFDNDSDGDA